MKIVVETTLKEINERRALDTTNLLLPKPAITTEELSKYKENLTKTIKKMFSTTDSDIIVLNIKQ